MERISKKARTVQTFTKDNVQLVLNGLGECIKEYCNGRGLSMDTFRVKWDAEEARITIKVKTPGGAEEVFGQVCELYGLKESDLGRTFSYNGETCTFLGLELSRRKYPFRIKMNNEVIFFNKIPFSTLERYRGFDIGGNNDR